MNYQHRRLILVTLTLLAASIARSETLYERVLIPLRPQISGISGANGSFWTTQLAMTNLSDAALPVINYDAKIGCVILECPPPDPIPPHATIMNYNMLTGTTMGVFLEVAAGRSRDLALSLRVQDESRGFETWGTIVPVVRGDDLFSATFGLSNIPTESHLRSLLRLYDADATTPPDVIIRIYAMDPDRDYPSATDPSPDHLITTITPTFDYDLTNPELYPACYQIRLDQVPGVSAARRVRVEIAPRDGRKDYWGFVSVTDNDTQHVTIISP